MARYISRYAGDVRILRVEQTELIRTRDGEWYPQVRVPALVAEFKAGLESTYEKNYALAAFTGRLVKHPDDDTVSFGDYLLSPFGEEMRLGGALPNQHPSDVPISGPGGSFIMPIAGYDITQKMSTFDTTWPNWSPEDQIVAEELLDLHAGQDYFKVSRFRVKAPWPAYDEMRGTQGAHMAIPKRVREMGFDPAAVLAYEEQFDEPKQGVIDGLRALIEETAAKAAEDDALTVIVS